MDQYIGKLLDNRYEILELVGVGGMARVYKARCHRLNRLVAIKILREDLAKDVELRRRFHDESQAVAMLSHPNIVSVYDVSRSSELEYIVMELIDGITLKQYMQKKGNKLNWREALHFITQIVKALGHAHSRGIIHRDIKPHNVMVLRDGSVKVADFGIARVMSGGHSTLTQEALGSVHYISPEQARGSHIDARSDLYSAGVVLYEMTTGRLPFEGDTPVSVAIQHINSIPLSPREIDSSIPEALESITMKAMSPDPNNRYPNADAMLADLEAFRKNPNINFDYSSDDLLVTEESDEEKTRIHTAVSSDTRTHGLGVQDHSDDTTPIHIYDEDEDEDSDQNGQGMNEKGKKPFPWPIVAAVGGVLVFVLAILIFLFSTVFSDFFGPSKHDDKVPDLIGLVYEDVIKDKELLGDFEVEIGESIPDETAEPGTILDQTPEPDSKPEKDSKKITVTVSSGPSPIVMVDLTGKEYKEAYLAIEELGLTCDTPDYEYHSKIPENHVISFTPFKDTPVKPGDEVHLVVSKGPKISTLSMPNLVGSTQEEAEGDISLMKLKLGDVRKVYSSTVPAGSVVEQYPAAGTEVEEGTKVNLRISKGPDPSTITPPKPETITKHIDIPLPDGGEVVKVVVMVDGTVVLDAEYDTAMQLTVPVTVSGPKGTTKSLTWFYNGVLGGSKNVELVP